MASNKNTLLSLHTILADLSFLLQLGLERRPGILAHSDALCKSLLCRNSRQIFFYCEDGLLRRKKKQKRYKSSRNLGRNVKLMRTF